MNESSSMIEVLATRPPSQRRALRQLFMTLFLRGRSARGIRKQTAPQSVLRKLFTSILAYTFVGFFLSVGLFQQPIFTLAAFLHSMTFVFLGLFIAASAGEILFNNEEADILLHRPVTPRALLWAKIGVLVQVSLWLAAALNFAGLFVSLLAPDQNGAFIPAHVASTALEALFCAGSVVLVYQLCLRWFGRERLEGLMTTAQVILTIGAVVGSQLIPRMMTRGEKLITFNGQWWAGLLPPLWFASIDDALAGGHGRKSIIFAVLAVVATVTVLWLAFGKLAGDYESGLQLLAERATRRRRPGQNRRWLDLLVNRPPLAWLIHDPVKRASFLLAAAYLARDRDVKLRMYPGIAPMLIVPIMFLLPSAGAGRETMAGFGIAFTTGYLGIVPLLAMGLLQFSQQWQASDVFIAAPLAGPARICDGARRAILVFLTLPVVVVFGIAIWLLHHEAAELLLLLPGLISLPVYALAPNVGGASVPLSRPTDEAKSASRGIVMTVVMISSIGLSTVAWLCWSRGVFEWFLVAESAVAALLYAVFRASLNRARWQSAE